MTSTPPVSSPGFYPTPPPTGPAELARALSCMRDYAVRIEGKTPATADILERTFLRWRLGAVPLKTKPLADLAQLLDLLSRKRAQAERGGTPGPWVRADAVLGALQAPPCPHNGDLALALVEEISDPEGVVGLRAHCPGCGTIVWLDGEHAHPAAVNALRDRLNQHHGGKAYPVVAWVSPAPSRTWAEEEALRATLPQDKAALAARVGIGQVEAAEGVAAR
jgi:hypothetical protein